jgi:hypothetical protein
LDAVVEPVDETDKVPDFVTTGDTVPIIFIEGLAEFVELADRRADALDDRVPLAVTEGVVDVLKEAVALADVDKVAEAEAERLPRFDVLPEAVTELLFDTVTEDDPVFVEIAETDFAVLALDDADGFIVTETVLEGVCDLVLCDEPVILGDAEDERLTVDDRDGREEALADLLTAAETDAVRETYDVIDTAADRVGLDVTDEERDGLPEGVFVLEEEGVLLILALPLAVRLVVVVLDEVVEPDDVLLTVVLIEEKGLDVGVLELAAVRVLVLLAVVVLVGAADATEI